MALMNAIELAAATRVQRVVVEPNGNEELLVMFASGDILAFDSPEAVLAEVTKRSRRGNKTVTFTRVEWRNMPEGFVPPAAL
jgi:SHS2 domain-containing protein